MGYNQNYRELLERATRIKEYMADIDRSEKLDKDVSLAYLINDNQSSLHFKCQDDGELSFKIHNCEISNNEFIYWQATAAGEEMVLFNGSMNRLFKWGLGTMRGYVRTLNDNHQMGLVISQNKEPRTVNRARIILTEKDLEFYHRRLRSSLFNDNPSTA